ncbi:MAG: hypothetical protein ACTHQM_25705 [Thermoanaerobaculia bacterium]
MPTEQVIGIVSFVLMFVGAIELRIRQVVSSSAAVQQERHIAVAQTLDRVGEAVERLTTYVRELGTTIADFRGRLGL